jgi:hypothetical protein
MVLKFLTPAHAGGVRCLVVILTTEDDAMKFTRDGDINGTSFKGHVMATYSQLVALLGEPGESDGYKVSGEWVLKFEDDKVATIYDWKSTALYDGELPSVEDFRKWADEKPIDWHVGGHDSCVVDRVREIIAAQPRVKTEAEKLQDIGRSAYDAIKEMVAALECDYDRLEELREMQRALETDKDAEGMSWQEVADLGDLETEAGECTSREEAAERIRNDALDVQVRSDWYSYGNAPDAPTEFYILISTGGPATRLIGELGCAEPCNVRLEAQDWGTQWTKYADADPDILQTYASQFYFGES